MSDKPAKAKLTRDSFTMPKDDYALIDVLKTRAIEGQRPAKKSELLRAGLKALAALDTPALVRALNALTLVKTGRPKAEGRKKSPTASGDAAAAKGAKPSATTQAAPKTSAAPAPAPKAKPPAKPRSGAMRGAATRKPAAKPAAKAAAKTAVKPAARSASTRSTRAAAR